MKGEEDNLPDFLYNDSDGVIRVGTHGDEDVTKEWQEFIGGLEERSELKSVIIREMAVVCKQYHDNELKLKNQIR